MQYLNMLKENKCAKAEFMPLDEIIFDPLNYLNFKDI